MYWFTAIIGFAAARRPSPSHQMINAQRMSRSRVKLWISASSKVGRRRGCARPPIGHKVQVASRPTRLAHLAFSIRQNEQDDDENAGQKIATTCEHSRKTKRTHRTIHDVEASSYMASPTATCGMRLSTRAPLKYLPSGHPLRHLNIVDLGRI